MTNLPYTSKSHDFFPPSLPVKYGLKVEVSCEEMDARMAEMDARIAENPNDAEAYYHRAEANLYNANDYYWARNGYPWNSDIQKSYLDNARKDSAKAIELNPNDADAHLLHGLAQNHIGEMVYRDPISHFQKALEINPDDADVIYHISHYIKNPKQALESIEKAISLKPILFNAWEMGQFYAEVGNHDKVIEITTADINSGESYAHAYDDRAKAYHTKGEFDSAIADWTVAIEKNCNAYGIGKYSNSSSIGDFKKAIGFSGYYTPAHVDCNNKVSYSFEVHNYVENDVCAPGQTIGTYENIHLCQAIPTTIVAE